MEANRIHKASARGARCVLKSVALAVLLLLLPPAVARGAPPADPHLRSVPDQLTAISAALDDLKAQIDTVESGLSAKLVDLQASVDAAHTKLDSLQVSAGGADAKLDALQAAADAASLKHDGLESLLNLIHQTTTSTYGVVAAANITLTTEICLQTSAIVDLKAGVEGEAGAGWPNAAHVKAAVIAEGGLAAEASMDKQICITVPLYKVVSNQPVFTNTDEFDDLVAAIALPAQNIVPLVATIYTELMPTPEQTVEALGNTIKAATGVDIINGTVGDPNPALLARPDILLDPIIPEAVRFFLSDSAPNFVATAVLNPCLAIADSPFASSIDLSLFDWLCFLGPQETQQALEIVSNAVDIVLDILDPLNLVH